MLTSYGKREWIGLGLILTAGLVASLIWLPYVAPAPALLLAFVLFFFRDPPRRVPPGEDTLVAPADGKVILIDEVENPEYLAEPSIRIVIFLSLFNCHLNRAPCAGRVEFLDYRPGRFRAAWADEATEENEMNSVGIGDAGPADRVLVRQIAGLVARRIVCVPTVSTPVAKGERIGMIKFGSRTELLVPKRTEFRPLVEVGSKVKAGLTIMGEVPPPDVQEN